MDWIDLNGVTGTARGGGSEAPIEGLPYLYVEKAWTPPKKKPHQKPHQKLHPDN